MTGKTKKDLQAENSLLKEELADIKAKFAQLSEKYKILEQSGSNSPFKCYKCSEKFQCHEDLKYHLNNHKNNKETFKCVDCDSEFNEQWKMLAHKENHTKFKCDICEKIFNSQLIKEKHVSISHDKKILYCHYFNNKKKCPFDDKCIFIHEDSEICKYGTRCERNMCMYKHEKEDDNENYECEYCDFVTTTKANLDLHLDEEKRYCKICEEDYDSVDYLKEHIECDHKQ